MVLIRAGGFPPMLRPPLAALAACCTTLLGMCGSSGSGTVGAGGSSADLNTDSYLGGAIDPDYVFHWTPRRTGGATEIFVEVQNAPSELPAQLLDLNYGPAACATAVRDGFNAWTKHSGVPMRLMLALHEDGDFIDPELVRIEVSFRSGGEPGLVGYTQLITAAMSPTVVERVQVEIRIGADTRNLTGEMVYALLLHEFGHALGIVAPSPRTGHSNKAADVMFPTVRWSELSQNDRLALRELYELTPTMRRADEVGNAPDGPGGGDPGAAGAAAQPSLDALADPAAWLRAFFRPALRSAPARLDPELLRCGSCARVDEPAR